MYPAVLDGPAALLDPEILGSSSKAELGDSRNKRKPEASATTERWRRKLLVQSLFAKATNAEAYLLIGSRSRAPEASVTTTFFKSKTRDLKQTG